MADKDVDIPIPTEQIYKFVELDIDANPTHIIVFKGNGKSIESLDEVFSELEIAQIEQNATTVEFSKQLIHKDDSIENIKKKLVSELDRNDVSLHEIYLYSIIHDKVHLLKFFKEITQDEKVEFSHEMLGQLLCNLRRDLSVVKNIEQKSSYSFEDLVKILNVSEDHELLIPIGQKFSTFRDLLFSANPFHILPTASPVYQQTTQNAIYVFENHLLLNYNNGNFKNNTIYYCLIERVLDYATTNGIDDAYMINLYYPLLEKEGILSRDEFVAKKQDLIAKTKQLFDSNIIKLYKSIDMLYDVYYSRTGELPYTKRGITEFNIVLHPEFKTILPLDLIFKNIHATKLIPFIKYNPGSKFENIYRLYSEKMSKSGKKIPYLKKPAIMSMSKLTGKIRQVSLYIRTAIAREEGEVLIELYMDFEHNGNITLRCELPAAIDETELLRILLAPVNDVITDINAVLQQSGYKIAPFMNLRSEFVEFTNLKYVCEMELDKKLKLEDHMGWLTSIFEISDTDLKKGALLRFKRVENYKHMNLIDSIISEIYTRTQDIAAIVNALVVNYDMSKEQALLRFQEFLNQFTRIQGRYVNKSMDIAENPGFPINIRVLSFQNKILIEIEKIIGIDYIDVLNVYIDSFLRITQHPTTSSVSQSTIKTTVYTPTDDDETFSDVVITHAKRGIEEEEEDDEDEEDEDVDIGLEPIDEDDDDDDGMMPLEEDSEDDDGIMPLEEDDDGIMPLEDDDSKSYVENGVVESKKFSPSALPESDSESENLSAIDEIESSAQNKIESPSGMSPLEDASESTVKESSPGTSLEPAAQELIESPSGMSPLESDSESTVKESSPGTSLEPAAQEHIESPSGMSPLESDSESTLIESPSGMSPLESDSESRGGVKGREKTVQLDNEQQPAKFFVNKIKRLDPKLILVREEGKYKNYARACPVNVNRQPVILTDEEKTKIDRENRGAYGNAIRYGSNPNKKFWYICPRYWCLKTQSPLTEEQVAAGECAGGIHEFTSKSHYDTKDKSKYVEHNPGFLPEGSHPTSCLPCCFKKNWNSDQLQVRRDQCDVPPEDTDLTQDTVANTKIKTIKPLKKKREDVFDNPQFYVIGFDKYPIQQDRWGFLPPSMQLFLNINYVNAIDKRNAALIKNDSQVLLRHGVEHSQHQSFIACVADIYGHVNRFDGPPPTISEMRNIIAENITLDIYLKCHNGSLVSIFQPKRIRVEDAILNKYHDTAFYASIKQESELQTDFFENTVASFENFLDYLRDDDALIDHTYLWDIITIDNPRLFPGGLNLVIMEIADNDITDNVELVCPTNSYADKLYDSRKETVLMVKHGDFYEPIYLYKIIETESQKTESSTYLFNSAIMQSIPELKSVLSMIDNTVGKYCKARPSMPREYQIKKNISLSQLITVLKQNNYTITSQVMNYNGKIIGLMIKDADESTLELFVPSFLSAVHLGIETMFMDEITWLDYELTRDSLLQISTNTGGIVLCRPEFKVIENNMIVGILTETNQFLQVNPIANDIDDDLIEYKSIGYGEGNYYEVDKSLVTSNKPDTERITAIQNISLESQFYSAFRTTVRILLNEYSQRTIRYKIIEILEKQSSLLYRIKLKQLTILLKHLMRNSISFDIIDPELLSEVGEISTCSANCDSKKYCLMKNGACTLIIPKLNLINGAENSDYYFGRLSDELLRYKRIRLFMLDSKKYLNISNSQYSINPTEFILLQSLLEGDYFDDLIPFQMNDYVKNITYDLANPVITQKYDTNITLDKQYEINEQTTQTGTFMIECVKETLPEVIGNRHSFWKKKFAAGAREVVFNDTPICSFYLLIDIFQKRFEREISVQTLKLSLCQQYDKLVDYKIKIIDILSLQNGKKQMMNRVKRSQVSLNDLIMSEEYYLTNLDLWALSDMFNLPILLFTEQGGLSNLMMKEDFVIFGGDRYKDKYYCVRSPAVGKRLPDYHLITPHFGLREISLDNTIGNPEFINNHLSLIDYLKQKYTLLMPSSDV
jgi:hypothetical protein